MTATCFNDRMGLSFIQSVDRTPEQPRKWKTGAGRFVEADHSFVAWAESKKTESFAEGHWEATDDGRLCMIAAWTNRYGAQDNRTCFVHLRDRGTIYQRREPDGRWYIFKNYLNKPDDEFRKLSQVDSVSAKAERLKKSLEKGRIPRCDDAAC